MDVNGDGQVTKEEYLRTLERDAVLFDTFTEYIAITVRCPPPWRRARRVCSDASHPPQPAMSLAIHRLRTAHKGFNPANTEAMFKDMARHGTDLDTGCTLKSVRGLFKRHFMCKEGAERGPQHRVLPNNDATHTRVADAVAVMRSTGVQRKTQWSTTSSSRSLMRLEHS